jgi:radical SAM protein with 4Fe4S-binding SPASM domain
MKLRQASMPRKFFGDLLRSPDVLAGALRMAVRRRATAQFDYVFRDGKSAPLSQIDLKLTNVCDLRCQMCGQWGEAGWHLSQPRAFLQQTLPLDTYCRMVDDVAAWRPWFFIYGGEPLLYHDVMPLVSYMKHKESLVTLVTNGGKLQQLSSEMVSSQVDIVMVSIDGPREVHDRVRGRAGSFDRAVAGLKAVQEEKRVRGLSRPFTTILVTINTHNTAELDKVFEVAEDAGVDGLICYYAYFQTEESCAEHEAIMESRLNTTPRSPRGFMWNHLAVNTAELLETRRRIQARSWSFAYVFAPELADADIPLFYQDHKRTFGYNRCVAPWLMITVLPNGDVAPCRDYPDYVVGNIAHDRLTELWNGERLRDFRGALKEEGLFPICRRCCGLMDW